MYRLLFVALPLLFIVSRGVMAQSDRTNSRIIMGKIVDDSLGYALPFVHLWNESTGMGSISSESGEFGIRVNSQDTVSFSALGYAAFSFVVEDSASYVPMLIRLKSKKYEIAEVVVRRWSSYAAFKHDFLNLELPGSELEPLKAQISVSATAAAIEADYERAARVKMEGGFGVTSSMGGGINREKENQEKIRKLKEREKIIRQKFNREMVGEITGLEGEDLTKFIALCNFSEDYILNTDLYSIVEAISTKFDLFQHRADSISTSR